MTMEDEMTTEIGHIARDHYTPDRTRGLAGPLSYAKASEAPPTPGITLSSVMGRLQAAIERAEHLGRSLSGATMLLAGEVPPMGNGSAVSKQPSGTLYQADEMVTTLNERLGDLQQLIQIVEHRLS